MVFDKILSVGRIRVALYDNYTNRPTIIFLHDSLGCIELWRDFPTRLGDMAKCNVLVYDRLGYGKSDPFSNPIRENDYMEREADTLNELLCELEINNAILFGHSDGGTISLIAGAKYPAKILGIIVEGVHVFVEEVTLIGIREAVNSYQTSDLKSKLERYHGNKTDELFWAWTKTWTNEKFRNWNIDNFLPLINCPSMVIQGENDEFGTLEQVEKTVMQTTGHSTKLILSNIGHNPHKEIPELILGKSSEFINRVLEK